MASLHDLPVELLQMVAGQLTDDNDLCRFRSLSHTTRDAIDGDFGSFWRCRFLSTFDPPRDSIIGSRAEVMRWYVSHYKSRRSTMRKASSFTREGRALREASCLKILRSLAIESLPITQHPSFLRSSNNMDALIQLADDSDLLKTAFAPSSRPARDETSNPLYHAMIVLLTALSLNACHRKKHVTPPHGFHDSQRVVYGTTRDRPLFTDITKLDVDMTWLAHAANFWRYHITSKEEYTVAAAFDELPTCLRPRLWQSQLKQGPQRLGGSWLGCYSHIESWELRDLRVGPVNDRVITDIMNHEDVYDGFQSLRLDFPDFAVPSDTSTTIRDSPVLWPDLFERHLEAFSRTADNAQQMTRTRAQRRKTVANESLIQSSIPLQGTGGEGSSDTMDFFASGWLTPLPVQCGIPGWQRITMMKYFQDEFGHADFSDLWAYEGIVLPGGEIILGRWWRPDGETGINQYSGPFIMWHVDDLSG